MKKSPPFVKKVETWGKKLESRISNCQKRIEVYNERLNIPSWMSDIENYYKLMTREPEIKCLMNKMLKVMTFNDLDEITGCIFTDNDVFNYLDQSVKVK